MPKMKPHSGMGKRIRVTGKGRLFHEQAGMQHLMEVKSSRRTRRLSAVVEIAKVDRKRVKKLLGR